MKRFILSTLFFITLLVIWHLLVLAKVWSPVLLPDPISVWDYLKSAAADGTLLEASLVTMRRLLTGYVIDRWGEGLREDASSHIVLHCIQ